MDLQRPKISLYLGHTPRRGRGVFATRTPFGGNGMQQEADWFCSEGQAN